MCHHFVFSLANEPFFFTVGNDNTRPQVDLEQSHQVWELGFPHSYEILFDWYESIFVLRRTNENDDVSVEIY